MRIRTILVSTAAAAVTLAALAGPAAADHTKGKKCLDFELPEDVQIVALHLHRRHPGARLVAWSSTPVTSSPRTAFPPCRDQRASSSGAFRRRYRPA